MTIPYSDSTENRSVRDQFDRPIRDLRISVIDRCNFRCDYCMPQHIFKPNYTFLPRKALLSYEQIERLIKIFYRLGVRKVRLTGGEPLLRQDIDVLIRAIKEIDGIDLAMTTNASLLDERRVQLLKDSGLDRINISLDALNPAVARKMNPIEIPVKQVLDGIDRVFAADFAQVKINMVVQKGVNDSEIVPMARYFRGTPAVFRMIEFMDVGNHNQWDLNQVLSAKEMIARIHAHYPLKPADANYRGEVAKRWQYEDGQGEIGVISSITEPFCGDCHRARLSSIGELYTCLFAKSGMALKPLLESHDDKAIEQIITGVWSKRRDRYSETREQMSASKAVTFMAKVSKVEMSYIGG